MSKRRVLIIGDEGIALFLTNGKRIERECSLPWMVPHFEDELIDILKNKNSNIPVFILYDALEQQYRKEDIIKTNILDQKKLVQRKLKSLFQNVLSYSYIELKDKEKKKEKKTHLSYLIAAVPNTEQMQRIEYAITESNTDIAGFALLPVESSLFAQNFAKKISREKTASKWVLMISHHETGGIRQIFIKDGTLALTRLSPLSDDNTDPTHWAEEVYKGFTTTLSYISRYGFKPSDGLDIIVICNDQNKSLLQTYDFKGSNLSCYSVQETSKLFGFTMPIKKDKELNQYADILHAGWVARQRKLKMVFKIDWINKIAVPRKVVRTISLLMFLTMFGAAALSFDTWQKFNEIVEEIGYKETQQTVFEEEYQQESKIFDTLPVKPITIRASLESKETLKNASLYSYTLLEKIRPVLHGKARLLKLSYLDARNPDDKFKKKNAYSTFQKLKNKNTHIKNLQVAIRFSLSEELPVEERAKAVDALQANFQIAFPKHRVIISKQYGGGKLSIKTLTGQLGGQVAKTETQEKELENYAEISITGEHL